MCTVHLRTVDLNLLVPLQALLEERSVTRAGQRVHLSQPAMSRALERLRELLHDPLLIRSGGGAYELSVRGAELRRELEVLLPRLEQVWRGPTFTPAEAEGRVRLSMTDNAAALLLPHLVPRLTQAAPRLQTEVHPWVETSYEDLLAGKLDLVFSPMAAPVPLRVRPLFEDTFVCLVDRAHPFAGRAFSLAQYLGHRHIAIDTQFRAQTLVDQPLAVAGQRRAVVLHLPFFLPAVRALAGTDLVLTSPALLARSVLLHHPVRLVKAPRELKGFPYSMVWHPRLDDLPLHGWFRAEVEQAARKMTARQARRR